MITEEQLQEWMRGNYARGYGVEHVVIADLIAEVRRLREENERLRRIEEAARLIAGEDPRSWTCPEHYEDKALWCATCFMADVLGLLTAKSERASDA